MDTKQSDWVRLTLTDKSTLAGTEYVTIFDGVNGPFRVTTKSLLGLQLPDVAQTWTVAGTTYTGIKLNVTDTASASGSLLMDLQVGGTSKFKVSKAATITFGGAALTNIISDYAFSFGNGAFVYDTAGQIYTYTTYSLGIHSDTRWYRDAAYIFAQRNGTNAQTSRIYNTYTDASNYERTSLGWSTNLFSIKTENAGSGSARNIELSPAGGQVSVAGKLSSNAYQLNNIITDSTTARTLSAIDNGSVIYFTNSLNITVTTAANLGAGFACTLVQGGAGQITIVQGTLTTLVSYLNLTKSAGQYAVISAISPIGGTFLLAGNLV
jgi:hypothetical protein